MPYIKSKILFILHIPPPVNGASMVGQFIKESQLINTTFEADYINLTTAFSLDKIGKGGVSKLWIILKILKDVLKTIASKKYDLCYMTLTAKGAGFYKDFLIVCLLKLFGLNIIYHFHNKGVAISGRKWYNQLLYKITFNHTKCILLAPTLYKDIAAFVANDNVFFCPNGIPDLTGRAESTRLDLESSKIFTFLFLSNMMEEKGVFKLLQACALLKAKHFRFKCNFIGAWSDITEDSFKQMVEVLAIDEEVTMYGKKYNAEKIGYFKDADAFVFPTYYHNECFPLVLLEAMQFGLPIISTPEGAIAEMVIDKQTGLLTPQKDIKALAEAMEYMLTHSGESKAMGIAGRKRYEQEFTLSTFEENICSILNKSLPQRT